MPANRFTPEKRVRFLDHLAFRGSVRAAAAVAGISHEAAYRARRRDAEFAALWDAALVHARAFGESVLATQAIEGVEVPVWFRGELVGTRVHHDARLLLAHLGRLDKRVEHDAAAAARAGRFDELLAQHAGHAMPEGFAEAAEEALDWRERDAAAKLPPTREEWIVWRRSAAAGSKSARREAERMAAAAAAAAVEWDRWHAAAMARVETIIAGACGGARRGGAGADAPGLDVSP